MAKNFRMIASEKPNRAIHIRLHGDFDGTSAHELADMLSACGSCFPEVAVHTDGLRKINAFGLGIFHTKIKKLRRYPVQVVFRGKHKHHFIEE